MDGLDRGFKVYELGVGDEIEIFFRIERKPTSKEYVVSVADKLRIESLNDPENSRTVQVRPDGRISLPLIGPVTAAGQTADALAHQLQERYSSVLTAPQITVLVTESHSPLDDFIDMIGPPSKGRSIVLKVLPDGTVTLPLLPPLQATGRTVPNLQNEIDVKYFALGLDVSVSLIPRVRRAGAAVVIGEVGKPGRIEFERPATVLMAVGQAVSSDGLIWDFKLRQGVMFHDGSELTADDIVYSFQRLLAIGKAPSAPFLPILKPDSVTVQGRYSVRFQLDKPYGPFFAMIPMVFIVNPRVVKTHEKDGDWGAGWLASNEAGSGAYRLIPSTYVPLEHVDMEKSEDHFLGWSDNPRPIRKIEWRPTQVTSTRVLALLNGSLDMTDSFLPVDQVERIEKSSNAHVVKNATMRLLLIRMNNTKPPFDNVNARKCFAHAFNHTGFIDEIVKGNATRNPAPLPNNIWGYPKDAVGYEYDLAKAKEYFQKAVSDGAPMRRPIALHVQQALEQTIQAGQLFQSDLATLGINLKMVNDTFSNLTSAAAKPETTPDMWIHWISTYYVDPDNWIGQMYDSRYHGTWKASCWCTNPRVDELLRKARFLVEQEDRAPIYEEAARLVVADSPDIWIYNMIEVCGLANRVQGFRHCPVGSGGEVRWMHLAA